MRTLYRGTLLTLIATGVFLTPSPLRAELEDGLVAYWSFDGDLLDGTATGAHGTFFEGTGDPTLIFSAGQFGEALELNNFNAGAFDQYVEITGAPEDSFDFAGGSMSFSLWTKSAFLGVDNQTVIAKGGGSSWSFARNGDQAGPAFRAGGLSAVGDSLLYPLDDPELHHYIGIAEAGVGLKLYRDGELIAEASGDPALADSPHNLFIGANPAADAEFFRAWEGVIDDVGIWNRALTAAEVALLWNNGTGFPVGEATNPTDTDGDGLPDFYENNTPGLDANNGADAAQGADDGLFDNDGLTNLEEYNRGSDPNNPDTDGDDLEDGEEVSGALNPFAMAPTDLLNADSDGDGLSDGEEVSGSRNPPGNAPTDPNDPDTDGDGATDAQEVAFGFDPNDPGSSPPPLQRGLKGFWSFENDYRDGSGLGYHGTPLSADGSEPRFIPGKLGRAILMDGRTTVNHTVQIDGSAGAFDFPGGSVTVSAWVRLSIAYTAQPAIVAKGSLESWGLLLNMADNRLVWTAGSAPLSGGGTIAGPFWRHVVAVAEAGEATRLYLDGLLVAVGEAPALGSNGLPLEIGGNPDVPDRNWNGLIDEVVVWERALSPAEVRLLYNAGEGAAMAELVTGTDTDRDGMTDLYETAHGLDPNADDAALDPDGDALSNLEEHDGGSDPNQADTDGDGLDDAAEAAAGTNPLGPDSDGDGLLDGEEVNGSRNPYLNNVLRDPFDPDTDPPGDPTDPLLRDTDDDGLDDLSEILSGSDPNNPDELPALPPVIGYWPFDDQMSPTEDLSPRGNDGQVNGAGTSFVPGHTGLNGDFAIAFDGSSSSVTTGASLLSGLTEFTVAGWVSFTASQANRTGLFGQNDTVEFGMINANTLHFWMAGPGALDVNFPPPTGGWRHIAIVSNGTQRFTYIDGIQRASAASAIPTASTSFGFNIGGGGIFDASGNFFQGMIDDVAVWDTALTTDEIELLAESVVDPLGRRVSGGDPEPTEVQLVSVGFSGGSFEVSATGLSTSESYILRRSLDGQSFTDVGTPVTGVTAHVFEDDSPPAGEAIYQIWTTN